MKYQAILFDLDGTLLDTAGDLGAALNIILQDKNLPELSKEIIRPFAGKGSKGLLKLALDMDDSHPDFANLSNLFFDHYEKTMLDTTNLFEGIEEILLHLEKNNIRWGIVTNKPERFTNIILEKLNLHRRAACVVSGDTLAKAKPYPDPILHACKLLKVEPDKCLYVGDSDVDVIASKAAGTASLVAMYGYIPESESPEAWNADGYVAHPNEILSWV